MRETYAPVILARKAKRLRKETGNPNLKSKLQSGLSPRDLFLFSIVRPSKMLFGSSICFIISLYTAVIYAYLYILFTTFTSVYETQYNWSGQIAGLSFMGLGIGATIGQLTFTAYGNRIVNKHIESGDYKPEHRLIVMIPGGFFMPVGLFWYGWSVQAHAHWIVPILGTSFVGFGMLMTFVSPRAKLMENRSAGEAVC